MDDATFTRESFRATIAFSVLSLFALLLAALWYGGAAATGCALAAIAAAYVSQTLATFQFQYPQLARPAQIVQLVSAVLWVAGFLVIITAF